MDREACATVLCNPGEAQSLCLSLLLLGPLHSRLHSRCLSPLLVQSGRQRVQMALAWTLCACAYVSVRSVGTLVSAALRGYWVEALILATLGL